MRPLNCMMTVHRLIAQILVTITFTTSIIIGQAWGQAIVIGEKPYIQEKNEKKTFRVADPDFVKSPYTGMTRKHWKDAALYLLEGAFSYVGAMEDAMKFPKQPGKSYPVNESQVPTEKLEGLVRTLFVATPLLKENPDLELNGIRVADYYRYQIGRLIDPLSESYIVPRPAHGGPGQNLVEFGAMAMSMLLIPEILWDPLSNLQKEALANTMISYGDGPTIPSNWKFFNVFVLSFFKSQGYQVNEALLTDYLEKSLADYRGDGWYNDNPAYDYYSMWAFQMYGMIWSEFFGKEHYPELAAKFISNFSDLKDNYPYLFSRDGQMIMWGRSMTYRIGSIVPFPLMGFLDDPDINYGWARRIASGVIRQFFEHPDFLEDNVPTLGFYGAFEPAVQVYSCRGSVYWMGKAFLGLFVPEENAFWQATENEGPWTEDFDKQQVYHHFSKSTDILVTDYPGIGASEIRAWCHEKVADDWQKFRSSENYNRLAYNSAFPWNADGKNGEVAMNYVFKNAKQEWEALRLFTFQKYEDGVYQREAVLETNDNIRIKLTDVPLPNGILRIDKNMSQEAVEIRLGHYALPKLQNEFKSRSFKLKGHNVTILDNGAYQLAVVPLKGWDKMELVTTHGLHPESEESRIINLATTFNPNTSKDGIHATLMLWKNSGETWKNEDLMPLKELKVEGEQIKVRFKNGTEKTFSVK